jgi:pSer/pThr/pTyr-binding forkhead associated (FHA) protein
MAWIVFDPGSVRHSVRHDLTGITTIGRRPDCDVQLFDNQASKIHCRIHPRENGFWLEDMGSMNGTFVNGLRVRGVSLLADGDRVRIGTATGVFHDESRSQETPDLDDVRLPLESGQLIVERGGDLQLRLWNVAVGADGFVLRIPLRDDRPPSSKRLVTYAGKAPREELVLEAGDERFDALLAEARDRSSSLSERERVGYLTDLVYRTLGGRLDAQQVRACQAMCAPYVGKPMRIGLLVEASLGVCRHRAFLFFHLARALGLRAEIFRGAVPDGRHAWNEVRIDERRVFVDASLGVALDGAAEVEQAYGYLASRHRLGPTAGATARVLVRGEGGEERVALPPLRHELRKVPGDEEAVLLIYPSSALPDVRFLHVHLRAAGADAGALFPMPRFVAARVFSVFGDEAHHLMDAVDLEEVRRSAATTAP